SQSCRLRCFAHTRARVGSLRSLRFASLTGAKLTKLTHSPPSRTRLRARAAANFGNFNFLPSISRGGGPHEMRWRGLFATTKKASPPASLVPLPCKCRGGKSRCPSLAREKPRVDAFGLECGRPALVGGRIEQD